MRFLKWLGAVLLLTACAATGVQVKEEQLSRLEKGKTTYQEVISMLGNPTSSTLMGDGARMIGYTYVEHKTRAETFIPYVGAFVGGADTRANTVMLRFSKDGVLLDYMASANQFGTGLGAASGTNLDRVEQQPRQAP